MNASPAFQALLAAYVAKAKISPDTEARAVLMLLAVYAGREARGGEAAELSFLAEVLRGAALRSGRSLRGMCAWLNRAAPRSTSAHVNRCSSERRHPVLAATPSSQHCGGKAAKAELLTSGGPVRRIVLRGGSV